MRRAVTALYSLGCLVLVACGCGAAPTHAPTLPADPGARLAAIADEYVREFVVMYPDVALAFSIPGAPADRLTQNSLEAVARWRRREDGWRAELDRIDARTLAGRPEEATFHALREQVLLSIGKRPCREELWYVRHVFGWQDILELVAAAQPVATVQARADALARWRDVPRFLDTEIVNLREGLRRGYSSPQGNVRLVVAQMDALLTRPVEHSFFYAPAKRAQSPEFARELAAVIQRDVNPALKRYRDFLAGEYLARARTAVSVAALPDGAACYRAYLREGTTLPLTADEIHRTGLQQVAVIEAEMRTITKARLGTADVPAALERLRRDPAFRHPNGEAILGCARRSIERAAAAMPRAVGLQPRMPVEAQPYGVASEQKGTASYQAGAPDGSRPGIIRYSLYQPQEQPAWDCETTAFHEGIPGHHFQSAVAIERGARAHPIQRYFWAPAYAEGWALYGERLADVLGLFSSDLQRLGMLSWQQMRAARLVVDTGLHAFGWSRERAVEYLAAHCSMRRSDIESEVDRYVTWPGQATAYMIGALELHRLRALAQQRLGPRFDLRAFHDRLLDDGNVPLPYLRAKIERWATPESPPRR